MAVSRTTIDSAAAFALPAHANAADLVLRHAARRQGQLAIAIPRVWSSAGASEIERITFGELADRTHAFMRGLGRARIGAGDRVIVMIPVSADLYALVLAVMAVGASVVLIDGGMGVRKIAWAIADAGAQGIVSVKKLLGKWPLLPPLWKMQRWCADGAVVGTRGIADLIGSGTRAGTGLPRASDHEALITFTSGSTGRPKGADRTHGILIAQHLALDAHFPRPEGSIDMPCFPVVTLHNLMCGVTTVMPPVDLRAPGGVDPAAVVAEMVRWNVTTFSGAPAYLDRIARHVVASGARVPSLRELAVGGAPVSRGLARRIRAAFPGVRAEVIYGSTEAEPIASVSIDDVIAEAGDGHLVGAPADVVDLALIRAGAPHQLPPDELAGLHVAPGELGEIVVRGAHVNRRYVNSPAATRENKLCDPDGSIWHRTGDIARLDARGRLWLTGRAADTVTRGGRALQPLVIEALLDDVTGVTRAALIAHGRAPEGELVIEPAPGVPPREVQERVLERLAQAGLGSLPVALVDRIPVDGRHQSKIDRPALRAQRGKRGHA